MRHFLIAIAIVALIAPAFALAQTSAAPTNTEDDWVHTGHPRKFAAELKALGDPYLYYENTFGGTPTTRPEAERSPLGAALCVPVAEVDG